MLPQTEEPPHLAFEIAARLTETLEPDLRPVDRVQLDERVDRALSNVSERRRIALTLRWRHQFAPAQIAEVLGTTPEAVRVLLVSARQDLEELIR